MFWSLIMLCLGLLGLPEEIGHACRRFHDHLIFAAFVCLLVLLVSVVSCIVSVANCMASANIMSNPLHARDCTRANLAHISRLPFCLHILLIVVRSC